MVWLCYANHISIKMHVKANWLQRIKESLVIGPLKVPTNVPNQKANAKSIMSLFLMLCVSQLSDTCCSVSSYITVISDDGNTTAISKATNSL